MIKNTNKSQKELPDIPEEPQYKKKRTGTGQPRAKHKHKYETVLLKTYYTLTDRSTGKPTYHFDRQPTKVCTICGRISVVDTNPEFYVSKLIARSPHFIYWKDLSDRVLTLDEWIAEDTFSKFAYKAGDTDE